MAVIKPVWTSTAQPSPVLFEAADAGLLALMIVAKFYHTDIDVSTMAHELGLGGRPATGLDLVRAAKRSGLKARLLTKQDKSRLMVVPRPAILRMQDGAYFILDRVPETGLDTLRDPFDIRARPVTLAEIESQWAGEVLLVTKRVLLDADADEFGFGWFIAAAMRYKKPLIHVLVCSFFVQLFALVTPLFFQVVIDKVLVHKSIATLEVVAVGLVVIGAFDVCLQYLRSYALYHTASRIDVDLGVQIFERLFRLPVSYFETRATGQTVARVREIETIRTFMTGQGVTSIIDAIFTVIFFAVLFYYSPFLALIVTCTIPLYLGVAVLVRPKLRQKTKEKFNRGAMSQQYLVESVVGALTLKAAAVEPLLQQQWEGRLAAYVKTSFEALMLGSAGQVGVQYISKLTTCLILFFGAEAVISGDMSVGQLIAFNMISGQLVAPILRLSQLWQDIQQVRISVDRLGDIFNTPVEGNTNFSIKVPHREIRGAIALREVMFRYHPDGVPALSNLSLDIAAGEVVGIVGPSGSGKSTLTKLIQRLYVPAQGHVLIDGVDIAQVPSYWFRRQIGVVLQENILFDRTIHENIALSRPGMSRAEVIAVAQLAGADEFIQKLSQGYDTQIQERGANLSGGQRQRIAIARALARNPRILILDEATSALDYESEKIIQENMRKIVQGRTVLIVAHRLAAVRDCHRIVSMHEGQIVEDGSHAELLKKEGGLYSRLWSLQTQSADVQA